MSPRDVIRDAEFADDQSSEAVATGSGRIRGGSGRIYAVPADDIVGSSRQVAEALYRGLEILIALIGLILTLPVILVEAFVVCCDSPGAALFFHRRPGRSVMMPGRDLVGRSDLIPPPGGYDPDQLYYVPSYFTLAKLRTMYSDARTRFPELYAYRFAPGEFHRHYPTMRSDPRVTRAGRIMRKLSIDELANLWSVLVGDMRLVGPRPEAPEVLQYYTADEMYKFACKPGITGLAQINGRGLLDWGQTIAYDLEYVRRRGVGLDLKILLITLKQILLRYGAF